MEESQKKPPLKNPTDIVFERKFDTAIRKSTIEAFLERVVEGSSTFDDNLLLSHLPHEDMSMYSIKSDCLATLLSEVISLSLSNVPLGTIHDPIIQRALHLAWNNLSLQHHYSSQNTRLNSTNQAHSWLSHRIRNWSCPQVIINLASLAYSMDLCIRKVAKIESTLSWTQRREGNLKALNGISQFDIQELGWKFRWSGRLCYICTGVDEWILPRHYLLLIHNKVHDLLSATLLAVYLSGVCYSQDFWKRQVLFCKHLFSLCRQYGEKFFQIGAALEGLVVGETLRRVDNWDNRDLLDNLCRELQEDVGYIYEGSYLQSYLQMSSIPEMHELACLSKIAGHPLVLISEGVEKVYKRATEDLNVDLEAVRLCVCMAKKQVVKSYFFRHGKWPPCKIEPPKVKGDALGYACLKNIEPDEPSLEGKYGKIETADWARLEFEPFLHFQRYENCIPFLKDKTISLLRTDVIRHYLRGTAEKRIPWRETRLLLFFLLHGGRELDHVSYMKEYMEVDDLEELQNYLVTRLVPKEKEMKLLPRYFGACTYQERMRRLIQEKNAMHYLDLYSDEQALTLSELELSSRLYAFRKIRHAYADHAVVRVQLDASGWNNKFRHQSVAPVAMAVLDRAFDTNLYWKTMASYENTLHYVPDERRVYAWDGQLGGIEGLNQDTWDLVYLNQIRAAMERENLKYHMLVKGDDLRVAIMIPPNLLAQHPVEWWSRRMMESVSETAKLYGHDLKVQESYASEVYFSFSKAASVKTIELPQGMRKIMKVHGANNAFLETIDDYVASTFSNAHSAARVLPTHYGPFWVGLVWSYWYLLNHKTYKELSDDHLLALLLVPSMVGGFPIIYLHNMSVRAESDLLSPFLHLLTWCKKNYPSIAEIMDHFLRHRVPLSTNYEQLYRDPYSLQLGIPPTAKATLQSFVLPAVEKITKNPDMKELIRATKSSTTREVVTCLDSASPCDVKVLSSIFSCTPAGVLEELIKKFETGRSIYDLIFMSGRTRKQTERVLEVVGRADGRLHTWRMKRLNKLTRHLPHLLSGYEGECPAAQAQEIRERVWKRKITGITMPPLAHQVTVVTPHDGARNRHALLNHFLYEYYPPGEAIDESSSIHWASAEKRPFLGYTTRTGNIMPTVNFEDKDVIILRVKNLLDLLSWVTRSLTINGSVITSNLELLIKKIITIYSPITPEELAPFSSHRKGGTIQHHIRSRSFRESIVPNSLSNIYQDFVGHTDTHVTLRTNKSTHFRVNFLHILCHCVNQISVEAQVSPTLTSPRTSWAVTTSCEYCITPIEDLPIRIDVSLIPSEIDNPLKICSVDDHARETILRSFTDFNTRLFHTIDETGDLPHEIASYAISAEIIYKWDRTRVKLQNRHGAPALSSEAYQVLSAMSLKTVTREVGRTELKCIDLKAVFACIKDLVISSTLSHRDTFSQEEMRASYATTPATELPWYHLIERIFEVGRLAELARIASSEQQVTRTGLYNNVASAASWIGSICCHVPDKPDEENKIVFLTYMVGTDVSKIIRQRLDTIKWKILNSEVIFLMRAYMPVRGATNENDKRKSELVNKFISVCCIDVDDETVERVVAKFRNQQDFETCTLDKMVSDWRDNIEAVCEEDSDTYWGKVVQWGATNWPLWPWLETAERFDEGTGFQDEMFQSVVRRCKKVVFKIAVTNLDTAIQVVRSKMTPSEILEKSETIPEPPVWSPLVARRSHIGHYAVQSGPIAGVTEAAPVSLRDFTLPEIILMESHSRRVIGTTTSAMAKLVDLLSAYSLDIPLPPGSRFMCLGDGFGGFLECLAYLSKQCEFVFNTRPDREGIACYPESAYEALEKNGHRVFCDEIESGLWDLRERVTIEVLGENYTLVHILTCDAEVPWNQYNDIWNIWKNVVQLGASIIDQNGLVILKINLGAGVEVCKVCELALRWFRTVSITRSPCSTVGGECYLVCVRPIMPRIDVHREPDEVIVSPRCRELVQRAIDSIHKKFEEDRDNPSSTIFTASTPQAHAMILELPLLADTVIQSRLGVQLALDGPLRLGNYKRLAVIDAYCSRLKRIQKALNNDLFHDAYVMEFPGVDSYMHKMQVAMRSLALHGILYWLTTCRRTISWETSKLTQRHVIEAFQVVYNTMPKRLQLPDWEEGSNTLDWHLEGYIRLNPFLRFMEGVRAGQTIASCIATACQPRYRQKKK
ncbi:RNA-dependent RNA polymerase [Wenling crustacean virus 13]|uniref:RNA-directed RNA polymerase n=1 Tax=Wenling crustacean virus 13 TaxID=1923482 RepID=A0A1L3KN74_9VIRU|nr:RNA-dependent RNA polymerase [Wenling crustacean virus 13]APG78828.1 RNA-dependent RNA polymerase [Wenling crustacean virus 13]